MPLPFFYKEDLDGSKHVQLDEDTSKHIVQVLRMKTGEQIQLTDGKGNLFIAGITDPGKRKCAVKILSATFQPPPDKSTMVAISLVKNTHRFEWFLEKAAEIGVSEVVPLICFRTEKQHFRLERMRGILISAMLQSQQAWLPALGEPVRFNDFIRYSKDKSASKKFIAHCEEEESRVQLSSFTPFDSSIILIGPEGDFTIDEIELALQNDFIAVALGNTRLRTETAGIAAVTIISLT